MKETHYAVIKLTADEAHRAIAYVLDRRTEATLTGRVVQVGGIDHTPILQEPRK